MAIYLQFAKTAIKGQTQVAKFKDGLECHSFNFAGNLSVSSSPSNSTRTADHVSFSEVTLSRTADSASPQIMSYLAAAKPLEGDTIITLTRQDSGETLNLMTVTLTNVFVSNYSLGGGGSDLVESFSLNYAKIAVEYTKQKEEGGKEGVAPFVWDISNNS